MYKKPSTQSKALGVDKFIGLAYDDLMVIVENLDKILDAENQADRAKEEADRAQAIADSIAFLVRKEAVVVVAGQTEIVPIAAFNTVMVFIDGTLQSEPDGAYTADALINTITMSEAFTGTEVVELMLFVDAEDTGPVTPDILARLDAIEAQLGAL